MGEVIDNYYEIGYFNITIKILHMLMHLSKSYSISMSILHKHFKTTKNMNY